MQLGGLTTVTVAAQYKLRASSYKDYKDKTEKLIKSYLVFFIQIILIFFFASAMDGIMMCLC